MMRMVYRILPLIVFLFVIIASLIRYHDTIRIGIPVTFAIGLSIFLRLFLYCVH